MPDLNKSPALWAIYNTGLAIEACGASAALTEASILCTKALLVTEQEIDRLRQFDALAQRAAAMDPEMKGPRHNGPLSLLVDLAALAPRGPGDTEDGR
jgi:hypothetical protein